MKRLLIASTSLPPTSGGAEQVAWETAKRLATQYSVHILTVGNQPDCLRSGVSIHYLRPRSPYTLMYSTLFRNEVNSEYQTIAPSVLHSHIVLPWGYVLSKTKCAKVVTCHGSPEYPRPRILTAFLVKTALANADVVTAPSKWLADYVREQYHVPCRLLPNGVDTSLYRPLQEIETRANVVLYVGRVMKRKGAVELFEAAKCLPEYEFWVIGHKEDETRVPTLPNLKIMGFVDDLAACYNLATICVFPSYWENFPLTGLEAMSCGKAIIATKVGFSEYVEDGHDGVLIEAGKSNEITDSIRYLMREKGVREKLGNNARQKAKLYDWNVIIDQYASLYDGLRT